jgi:hypothetical protein
MSSFILMLIAIMLIVINVISQSDILCWGVIMLKVVLNIVTHLDYDKKIVTNPISK